MSRRIDDKPLHGSSLPQGGRRVGFMEWEKSEGFEPSTEISEIEVDPDHRRKGLATAALRHSQGVARASKGVIPLPSHSPNRTPEGDAWARSTGDPLPLRK